MVDIKILDPKQWSDYLQTSTVNIKEQQSQEIIWHRSDEFWLQRATKSIQKSDIEKTSLNLRIYENL